MATTVKITETYDLKTTSGKLGIIGIHTPSSRQIRQLYPGLVKNHRFIRLIKCDIFGACASVLPADPLSVGVTEGDVAPEDMFNPILYKPVSNQSFETVLSRIYDSNDVTTLGSVTYNEPSAGGFSAAENNFRVYYSLLSEGKKWKKAMPQRGFSLTGLVPICYQMINTYGQNIPVNRTKTVLGENGVSTVDIPDSTGVTVANDEWSTTSEKDLAITLRGQAVKMPRIPMHYGMESVTDVASFQIPKTFCAMFLIPPSRLHEFYYRMRVSWTVRFENVCPATEFANGAAMLTEAGYSYGRNYSYSDSKVVLDNMESSVDTNDVAITKIMES